MNGSHACPADVKNERNGLSGGLSPGEPHAWPNGCAACLAPAMQQLIQMHHELMSMVGALIEQNQQTLDAVGQITDDFDGPATHYMDGTPIR
jgi:hypothetical protein